MRTEPRVAFRFCGKQFGFVKRNVAASRAHSPPKMLPSRGPVRTGSNRSRENGRVKFTSSDALEFGQLRAIVKRYIATSAGDAELAKIEPSDDRETLERILAETGEAMSYLRAASAPQPSGQGAAIRINLNGVPNVSVAVQKLHI